MSEYDIIVIGGGSAGSAVAGRISEEGKHSVCLIEAGGRNDNFLIKTPGLMPFQPKNANWRFDTIPQKGLKGRLGYQPRGRGLGGSSAINAMVYIRGNRWDYDNWAVMVGAITMSCPTIKSPKATNVEVIVITAAMGLYPSPIRNGPIPAA